MRLCSGDVAALLATSISLSPPSIFGSFLVISSDHAPAFQRQIYGDNAQRLSNSSRCQHRCSSIRRTCILHLRCNSVLAACTLAATQQRALQHQTSNVCDLQQQLQRHACASAATSAACAPAALQRHAPSHQYFSSACNSASTAFRRQLQQ